jgi:alkaline phosphatase D
MVGYSSMMEVALWVQTKEEAMVHFRYWEEANPEKYRETERYTTQKTDAFTAQLVAEVDPGKKYQYELYINERGVDLPYPLRFQSQTLWQWRTDPPAFSFTLGSCTYINEPEYDRPGNPYGGGYEIFESMNQENPDFMLWLGDNMYLREVDWDSRTGVFHRYTHTRSTPEMQALLGGTHHYAIWDDHDYGPNDSDRSYYGKDWTFEAFRKFWANPNYNLTGKGGITGTFQWADVQFFLLDNRWFRTPNDRVTAERCILCEAQTEWLLDALKFSQASFKFIVVGGQFLSPAAIYENHAQFAEERMRIIEAIRKESIPGVLFLTGDRHHTELTKYVLDGQYPLYDFTVSPLTSGAANPRENENPLQELGTLVKERNYGQIEVFGPRNNRMLRLLVKNVQGKLIWTKEIKQSDLR